MSNFRKKTSFWEKIRMDSGVVRVARGGSGAKAPLLAARPEDVPVTSLT